MEPEPVQPIDPALHWQDAQGRAQVFVLETGETLVGRTDSCDLIIRDLSVSREHAKIICSHGIYLLVDLGTTSGYLCQRVADSGLCASKRRSHRIWRQ